MTRGLHVDTKVQRAQDGGGIPREWREAGYDPRDVPAAKVLAGVAAFLSLMVVGLIAVAVLVAWLGFDDGSPSPPIAADTPPPRILATPARERALVEAEAHARIAGRPIQRAMQRVAERGWGDEAPPPAQARPARQHREDLE